MKKSKKAGPALAADQVKRLFSSLIAVGGGGRGGKSSVVINNATRAAEGVACAFADYFDECEEGFDAIEFFRACCLPEKWIAQRAKAKARFEQKVQREADKAWREAVRVTKRGQITT